MTALLTRARTLAGRAAGRARLATCLIVPVFDAEPIVARWLNTDRVDFDGVPLHVTVMYPFLPARALGLNEEHNVAELARDIEPFDFTLTGLRRFPGVQYLAPEPAPAFTALTERVQRRWPSCRPYDGAYDAVIPHVTVTFGDDPPVDEATLDRDLPIRTRATDIWLLDQTSHGWQTRRRFPLGRVQPLPPKYGSRARDSHARQDAAVWSTRQSWWSVLSVSNQHTPMIR